MSITNYETIQTSSAAEAKKSLLTIETRVGNAFKTAGKILCHLKSLTKGESIGAAWKSVSEVKLHPHMFSFGVAFDFIRENAPKGESGEAIYDSKKCGRKAILLVSAIANGLIRFADQHGEDGIRDYTAMTIDTLVNPPKNVSKALEEIRDAVLLKPAKPAATEGEGEESGEGAGGGEASELPAENAEEEKPLTDRAAEIINEMFNVNSPAQLRSFAAHFEKIAPMFRDKADKLAGTQVEAIAVPA